MSKLHTTCWTMIASAAAGERGGQERFIKTYGNAIRDFLVARYGRALSALDLEDAVQEVYLECLRQGGVLENATPDRPGGFRPYLFGAVRNVARRIAARQAVRREAQPTSDLCRNGQPDPHADPKLIFDRSWARAMIREAKDALRAKAGEGDWTMERRFEVLRLRYEEGRPVREIAALWDEPTERLHQELRKAKLAFREALRKVVAFHLPGSGSEIDRECKDLLASLGRGAESPSDQRSSSF